MKVRFYEDLVLDEGSVEKALDALREVVFELDRAIEGLEKLDEQTADILDIVLSGTLEVGNIEDLKKIKSDIGLIEINLSDFIEEELK